MLALAVLAPVLASVRHGHVSSKAHRPVEAQQLILTHALLGASSSKKKLPKHHDWRDVDGISYTTSDVNQHIPVCTSPAPHVAAA